MFNKNWRPPKWTPELIEHLNKKITTDWKPSLGHRILYSRIDPVTCVAAIKVSDDSTYTYCSKQAVWWHPTSPLMYCDQHASEWVVDTITKLWHLVRVLEVVEHLPSLGVKI